MLDVEDAVVAITCNTCILGEVTTETRKLTHTHTQTFVLDVHLVLLR